jgi:formylglycine-generating enzyme required for sulfatase activity
MSSGYTQTKIEPGMVMPADYLHRTGYRLPTEAEWEFAARAGTLTAHFFGDGIALLDRYAWFMANSENHGWPVGTTKPNQFGLFDMYGNAWEWVQDRYLEYSTDPKKTTLDNEDRELVVTNDAKRIRREAHGHTIRKPCGRLIAEPQQGTS